MKIFRIAWMFIALLCAYTLTSCSNDDENDDEYSYQYGDEYDDGNTNGGNGSAYFNIIGRTFHHTSSFNYGERINDLTVALTFTSESTYSVTKKGFYTAYKNHRYDQYFFNETRTGNYKREGNEITMIGNYPYDYDDTWGNSNWYLTIIEINGFAVLGIDGSEEDDNLFL